MRALPTGLAAAIDSGTVGLCTVWILTRADGVRLGFTDHDEPLTVSGVTCSAASGWTLGAAHTELGTGAGLAAATAALDSDALNEADIAGGLYDQARLEVLRVMWSAPDQHVLVWRGRIVRLVRGGGAFTAEIEGPLGALQRVIGRTYSRTCDARLGDSRCRVDLSEAGFGPDAVCDKRWTTCSAVFANAINFQGFPDIPGDDFLTAAPASGGLNDGGSRTMRAPG